MTENTEKAYVVVRADMTPGFQIVQTAHAVAEHEKRFPGTMSGRTMIVLSIPNETALLDFHDVVTQLCYTTLFVEPDIEQHTAFAVSPSEFWGIFAGRPLAG